MTSRSAGLVLGPLLFAAALLLPAPAGMPPAAWRTAAVAMLLAVWWMTEALPLGATSLLPIILLPLLGIATVDAAAAPFAHPTVFLFLGGFLIALAVERSGLHRRAALAILAAAGSRPRNLVAGFMVATAALSMWISNTAATLMMLPMALSVAGLDDGPDGRETRFAPALLLGVAYGASIGGLGTLIGTPPNALLAAYMSDRFGLEIGFGRWMLIGVPLIVVSLPVAWLVLTRIVFRLGRAPLAAAGSGIEAERAALGPVSRAEWLVGAITAATALGWMFQPLLARVVPAVSDTAIALAGALLLFAVPVQWKEKRFPLGGADIDRLPWSVLLLFGGGLSLAAAIQSSGLAAWIGAALERLGGLPLPLLVLGVVASVVFLSELASNTAAAATFLPIAGALAVGLGESPLFLVIPAALAASCGFMLPVATPPNAIVYASGRIPMGRMIRAGFLLNVVMIALLTLAAFVLVPAVLGR
ncbi:MAG TPA: DASS family sodium-coupled anion symporter [Gemmatimonadales bacterium]